jgi:copper chaperone
MIQKMYQLETLSCPSCMAKIDGMLKRIEGILESEVLFNSSRVKVSFDETKITSDVIKNRIGRLGYAVLSEK